MNMIDLTEWKGTTAAWLNGATQNQIYNAIARGLIDLGPLNTEPPTVEACHMNWHASAESRELACRRHNRKGGYRAARDPGTGHWYSYAWWGLLNRYGMEETGEPLPWDRYAADPAAR